MHIFDPANFQKLDSEWRRNHLPPLPALEKLGLTPGDTVADIGCGIGYFAIPAAQAIETPHKVFALDTSEEMLAELERRAQSVGVDNVIGILTGEYDLKLPDASVSFALMVNVLHEVEDKARFLTESHRILKSSGRIAVIDWKRAQTEMGPPLEHRISREEVEGLLVAAGFKPVISMELAGCFYGLVMEKFVCE